MGCWESNLGQPHAKQIPYPTIILAHEISSFFAFWVTPCAAQGLLLALRSGITPGGAQGTIWDAGNRTRVGLVQGKRPTRCAITPAPIAVFSYYAN